jgi:hypothetical protein
MARTINEIYDQMVAEKQTASSLNGLQPSTDNATNLLSDLSTSSKVAIWRLLFYVTAVAIWILEKLFDVFKEEVTEIANRAYTGTVLWYQQICFDFQYGDTLTWNGNNYEYAVIDPAKQIIKRAAVVDIGGQIVIKVAKLSGTTPTPLTAGELTSFSVYMKNVKFAGTNMSIISRVADLLKISYDVVYDPLVLKPTGESIINTGVFPVEDAINNYISNLPFNGTLNLTKLTDEIQKAEGVVDPIINYAEAKYGTLSYVTIVNNYNANAGHMAIDAAFPLSSTINYIANV